MPIHIWPREDRYLKSGTLVCGVTFTFSSLLYWPGLYGIFSLIVLKFYVKIEPLLPVYNTFIVYKRNISVNGVFPAANSLSLI